MLNEYQFKIQNCEQMHVSNINGGFAFISEKELLPRNHYIKDKDNQIEDKSVSPQTIYQNKLNKIFFDNKDLNILISLYSKQWSNKIKKRDVKLFEKQKSYIVQHIFKVINVRRTKSKNPVLQKWIESIYILIKILYK